SSQVRGVRSMTPDWVPTVAVRGRDCFPRVSSGSGDRPMCCPIGRPYSSCGALTSLVAPPAVTRRKAMVPTKPGLRAFRYTLPTKPVATASVDIGHVGVRFELFLHGELDICAARRAGADDRAVRACTLKALRAMAKGLMVSGAGSYSPTIGSAAGHTFGQSGYRFTEPNT